MPRNISGVYTLPAGNPVVTGTTITSGWANETLSDLATAVTESLDRQGRGGMTGVLGIANGTVALPGLAFVSELSTGMSRPTTNQLSLSVAGTENVRLTTALARFLRPVQFDSTVAFSGSLGNITTGTINGQTISSAASFTGTLAVTGLLTASGNVETNQLQRTAAGTLTITATDAAGALDLRVAGASRLAINAAGLVTIPNAVETPTLQRSSAGALTITSSNAAGTIDIRTAGASALAIDASQISSFSNAVNISRAQNAGTRLLVANSNAGTAAFARLEMSNGSRALILDQYSEGFAGGFAQQGWLYTNSAVPLILGTNNAGRVQIQGTGEVGIGTPGTAGIPLHVRSANGIIYSETTAARGSNNNYISLRDASGEAGFLGYGSGSGLLWINNSITGAALRLATQGVGRVDISSGGIVDLVLGSGALRVAGHNTRFESAEQTCPTTSVTAVTVSHTGTRRPDLSMIVLRCVTAELNYAVGDEVVLATSASDGSATDRVMTMWHSTTQIGFMWTSGSNLAPAIRNKTTGVISTITAGNWRVVFKCLWL